MESTVLKRTHERLYCLLLSKIAREASRVANRENRALGLSIQIVENGYVVEKFPDGSKRIIKELVRAKSIVKLKKGSLLYLNQKD